jgi:hypothetical protein
MQLVYSFNLFLYTYLHINIGEKLSSSPFLLLAEDAFWESFLRDRLNDEQIKRILLSMRKSNRGEVVYTAHINDDTTIVDYRLPGAGKDSEIDKTPLFDVNSYGSIIEMQFMEKAFIASPYNIFVREYLRRRSYPWAERMQEDHLIISKIQSAVRGWHCRVHFPETRKR